MAILRGLSSRLLSCGCLVGVYETYDRKTVSIIDDRDPECRDETHRVNAVIFDAPGSTDPPQDRPDAHAR
jgi:hypothetical protein